MKHDDIPVTYAIYSYNKDNIIYEISMDRKLEDGLNKYIHLYYDNNGYFKYIYENDVTISSEYIYFVEN